MNAETYLLLVIAVLVVALVVAIAYGRMDAHAADELAEKLAAERMKNRHLASLVAGYRTDLARLSADNSHLRELNGELRDALSGEPSLTEAVYATLAELPVTDPEDQR